MHGKKPTRIQKNILKDNGLDPQKWLIQKNMKDSLQIINAITQECKTIPK